MFDRTQRKRMRRIAELKQLITEEENVDRGFGNSEDEGAAESQALYEATRLYENEVDYLLQEKLIAASIKAGIEIPADKQHFQSNWDERRTLTPQGEAWLKREIRKYRDSRVEFWAKLVLPIISIILSVVALLKKH